MKFLAVGDIANPDNLAGLLKLDLSAYAFLLLTGDMSGLPGGWKIGRARALNDRSFIPAGRDPKEYYHELLEPAVQKLKAVDENLGRIRDHLQIYAIYGNTDFRSIVERAQPKNFVLLHKSVIQVKDIFLVGYNGHPTYPWEIQNPSKKDIFDFTYGETAKEINSFKENEIYEDLMSLCRCLPNNRVTVLTHTPPYAILDKVKPELVDWAKSSYGESAKEGNVGSTGLRKFIIECEPLLSIFGHIHESKGVESINGTTCINVGSFEDEMEFLSAQLKNGKLECNFRRVQ